MKPDQQAPLTILLADDDEDDRWFFEQALGEMPVSYHLRTVPDGAKLMDYLRSNSERLPDVLFLDLNMPGKNGAECLSEIKQNPALKKLPVVIHSSSLIGQIADVLYQNKAYYCLQKADSLTEQMEGIKKVLTLLAEDPNQPSRDKFILNLEKA